MERKYPIHYIVVGDKSQIMAGWSTGPNPERITANAIVLREGGSYQFRLVEGGIENPPLRTEDGIPLYRWDGERVIARTVEEITADREHFPPGEKSVEERVDALEAETAAISAAIERGLSL